MTKQWADSIIRILIMIVSLAYSSQNISAQQWDCHWIAHPTACDTTQVWFSRTYTDTERPREAFITIASTGYFTLYVNGRNVSTDILTPTRQQGDTAARAMTFCVTRFTRNTDNTIAVWYSPTTPHKDKRQLSMCYYGKRNDGTPFVYNTDASWMCREASMSLATDGGENQNATTHEARWNTGNIELAQWIHAEEAEGRPDESVTAAAWPQHGTRITKTITPRYFDTENDSVLYDFAPGFYGLIRVTLRGCTSGQHININGLHYTCTGDMDEQAFGRFVPGFWRKVLISGDKYFNPEQIQSVEAIAIAP